MQIHDNYIMVGGYRHHYREAGTDGPDMLLLHGILSSLDFFEESIPFLARSFRVLALDLLGFGGSEKPRNTNYSLHLYADLIQEFLEKTGGPTAGRTIYGTGHSMGGKYLLAAALRYPQTFTKLVLSNTDGFIRLPIMQRIYSTPIVAHLLRNFLIRQENAEKMFAAAFHRPEAVNPSLYRKILDIALDDGTFETMIALNRNLPRLDMQRTGLRAQLGSLHIPTLIIWGDHDRYIPPKIAHIVQQELPGSKLVIFDECGHSPMVEQPARFCSTIQDFIFSEP